VVVEEEEGMLALDVCRCVCMGEGEEDEGAGLLFSFSREGSVWRRLVPCICMGEGLDGVGGEDEGGKGVLSFSSSDSTEEGTLSAWVCMVGGGGGGGGETDVVDRDIDWTVLKLLLLLLEVVVVVERFSGSGS